jgi:hypothetical protein
MALYANDIILSVFGAFVAGYASDKYFYFVDRLVGAIFPPREAEFAQNVRRCMANRASETTAIRAALVDPPRAP